MTVVRSHNGVPVRIEHSACAGGHTYVGTEKMGFHIPTEVLLVVVEQLREEQGERPVYPPVPRKKGKHV